MKKQLLPAISLALLTFCACHKPDNNTSTVTSYTDLTSAMRSVAVQSKIVTINSATGGSFRGNSGSRYIVPPNAFRTASGAPVTGDVQIEIKEFLKKSDMIFSNVLPRASSYDVLISAGEIFFNPTQNSQPLVIDAAAQVRVNMPNAKPDTAMRLFSAEVNKDTVVWFPAPPADGTVVVNGDTTSIITGRAGYCNADRFMTSTPVYQNFTVKYNNTSTGAALTQMTAYALYDTYMGVWKMGVIGSVSDGVITEMHVPSIPVHFLITGFVNGDFYGGIMAATPVTGSTYIVPVSKTTPSALKELVDAL